MRLPFLQVAMEVLELHAPELAITLKWSEGCAFIGLVRMFNWGLARVPHGELPSKHDVVKGPNAARLVARAAGWKRSPDFFVDACCELPEPPLERVEGGIRLCGLGARYDAALESAKTRSEHARAAAEARWGKTPAPVAAPAELPPSMPAAPVEHPVGIAQPMPVDAKTQTQTQTHEKQLPPPVAAPPENSGPTTLKQRLSTVFREERGADYAWTKKSDAALPGLEAFVGGDWGEAERRFRAALRRKKFPTCDTIEALVEYWNSYAGAPGQPAPKKPPPLPEDTQPDTHAGRVWADVLRQLRNDGKTYALQGLAPMVPLEVRDGALCLRAENKYAAAWARDHYADLMEHFAGMPVQLLPGESEAAEASP